MEIEATILNLDWDRDRISVSMKALEADPWDNAGTKYKPGSKHTGTVMRLTNFGAFVSLEPGLDGLLHISELDGESRINHPRDVLKLNQTLEVTIKSIDSVARKISLSLPPKTNEYEQFGEYIDDGSQSDTYNPFGTLLKKPEKNT